jgi:glycosyltransferase involved in cell wall biosynthesis
MNIPIGERMAERLAHFGVPSERMRIIPNWADGALVMPSANAANPLRQQWGLEGKFVVGYSGNLGRAHEIDTIIEAMTCLEQDCNTPAADKEVDGPSCNVIWLFIGGGVLYRQLQAEVIARELTSVQFRSYQPRAFLAESLSAADIHLVSLRPELEGLIVPSKYYGIAAVGRPTIFIGDVDGEIARILEAGESGQTVAVGDGVGLAALIRAFAANPTLAREMGSRSRSAFERRFDFPVAVSAWESALAAIHNDFIATAGNHPAGITQKLENDKIL